MTALPASARPRLELAPKPLEVVMAPAQPEPDFERLSRGT
jgi:hypothetical protein